jgi:hypothetical protein
LAWGQEPHLPPAALRRALEVNAPSMVEVSNGHRRGPGLVVGAHGQVITSTQWVGLDQAVVHHQGLSLAARVVAANASTGVALLELLEPPPATLRPSAVSPQAALPRGAWLVGIAHGSKGEWRPQAVQVLRVIEAPRSAALVDRPLPPGTPLFDAKGRLAGLVVRPRGRIGAEAVPVAVLRALAAKASR